MTAGTVLFGVDVLDIRRIVRAIDYSGSAYVRHVAADDELLPDPDVAVATAATVAVKEALIKAVGGRPPGFTWHDFARRPNPPDLPESSRLLGELAPQITRDTGITLGAQCTYRIRGASHDAALARLGVTATDGPSVAGVARWGRRDDTVVALAVLVPTTAKESS
ncbi:4'-phosphopantetheinyl transferase [Prauserella rugosa]|uniref:Holo-[acyl-carrier protein] synthase n=1 Tax=Prauserella rugosa TaxID=43354 RepID=A0A660CH70_9PSEU|nr:4'-phosphopantetheinyl transferase [Prauserella rugosa]KID30441.1 hypothetical protein HQ32_01942 [Prauserella sp. Am3]TWH20265.1 holo-[acyl-carrier protein] synthase [Prauserella rugosa]